MLSFAAWLLDPLGLICPIVTLGKILIQNLWALEMGWDDEIPADVLHRWKTVSSCFTDLETLNIPRHVGTQLGGTY